MTDAESVSSVLTSIHLEILERTVRVSTDDPELTEAIAQLWHPFAVPEEAEPAAWIVIERQGDGWILRSSMASFTDPVAAWEVLLRSKQLISRAGLDGRDDLLVLHSGAISRKGETLLLAGPAGAGKTTLCADLVRQGWTYLGDDVAPVAIADGRLHPIPRPPAFKGDTYVQADFTHTWSPPPILSKEPGPFLVPPRALGPFSRDPVAPTRIVLPEFRAGSGLQCETMSAADAMRRLSAEVHDPQPVGVRVLADMARDLPVLYLRYGTSKDALDALSETIPDL